MTFLKVCDNECSPNAHYAAHCANDIQYKLQTCIRKFKKSSKPFPSLQTSLMHVLLEGQISWNCAPKVLNEILLLVFVFLSAGSITIRVA